MANDTFDIIDQLLAQSDALDRTFRQQFPDLYRDDEEQNGTAAPGYGYDEDDTDYDDLIPDVPVMTAAEPEDDPPPAPVLDEDTLQAYRLRRKYMQQEAVGEWESASLAQGELLTRMEERPASLGDEELFLYAATCLAERREADAGDALALMLRRQGESAALRFLPLYTALDSGRSRQQLRQLTNIARSARSGDTEQAMLAAARDIVREVLDVVEAAEALEEKGYRNKQEALRKAQETHQRRYDRLNSML